MEKKNVFVYLRGNKEHGAEIIKYLEDLGGYNAYNRGGGNDEVYYFINGNGVICDRLISNSYFLTSHYHEVVLDFKYKPKDKELAWCRDNSDNFSRYLCFYDSINDGIFDPMSGKRNYCRLDSYEPFEGKYPQWAKEALAKLKD